MADLRAAFPADFELILASQSPRRHSLLRDMGTPFRVVPSRAEEALEGGDPRALAEANALAKVRGALFPAEARSDAFILGTDTVVASEGRVMGKPSSAAEAAEMLVALSGRTHEVVSGVALLRRGADGGERVLVESAVTRVTFLPLTAREVEAYVLSGEWRGKAGGYAIQGLAALFAAGIEGEYSNVVGLPLCLLARMFRDAGFDLLTRSWL